MLDFKYSFKIEVIDTRQVYDQLTGKLPLIYSIIKQNLNLLLYSGIQK